MMDVNKIIKEVFGEPEPTKIVDPEEEEKIISYSKRRLPGLEYKHAEAGFNSTQYHLRFKDPAFAPLYRGSKIVEPMKVLFDSNNVVVRTEGSTLIVDVPKKRIGNLSFGSCFTRFQDVCPPSNDKFDVVVGETLHGDLVTLDMQTEHWSSMLVGGASGSGKSVCTKNILLSALLRHDDTKLVIIDTEKKAGYEAIAELNRCELIKDRDQSLERLAELLIEINQRNEIMQASKYYEIKDYNEKVEEKDRLPHIIVVIEETDTYLSHGKSFLDPLLGLVSMGRSAGIHCIFASQKPVSSIISTSLRDKISGRIGLRTNSKSDSRVILGTGGCEHLSGGGDAYVKILNEDNDIEIQHMQCAFISNDQLNLLTKKMKEYE